MILKITQTMRIICFTKMYRKIINESLLPLSYIYIRETYSVHIKLLYVYAPKWSIYMYIDAFIFLGIARVRLQLSFGIAYIYIHLIRYQPTPIHNSTHQYLGMEIFQVPLFDQFSIALTWALNVYRKTDISLDGIQ